MVFGIGKRRRPTETSARNTRRLEDEGSSYDQKGELQLSSLCSNTIVQVTSAYLTCDSPGAYYYGGNSYRNSETCSYGDKANLYMKVTIRSDLSQTGVDVEVYAGVFDRMLEESVVERTDLCGLQSVGDDDAGACPEMGKYEFYTTFQVPSLMNDPSFSFTPDVSLKFFSAKSGRRVGCASTGTIAIITNAASHSQDGQMALGLAIILFCATASCLLYLSYQRKKKLEAREVYHGYYVQGSNRAEKDFPISKASAVIRLDGRSRSRSLLLQQEQEQMKQLEGQLPAWG